ncbi:MAG TPA: tetratricopeptide repeat protein [Pyrinomonadaceae bacterium]|nr:tetratricopeptide repeat protein [Pyrinomonadaceae bacterium]
MHSTVKTSLISLVLIVISLGCLCAPALAQSMDDTVTRFNGRNTITGMIFWPDGTPANARIRVRLSGERGVDTIGSSGGEGRFSFSRVSPGLYTVTIDEDKEHGSASATVEVLALPGAPPQTFQVMLRLSPLKGSPKAAVVSAEDAGVPKNALASYKKALDAAKSGDHNGAITLLQKALTEYKDFLAARTELGVQYLVTGDLDKADAALAEALRLKPDSFPALVNRGIALLRLDRPSDAEPLLERASKINTASSMTFFYLGRVQLGLKKYDAAEASLKTSAGLGDVEGREAHRTLAKLYIERNEDAKAIVELETYLRLNPAVSDAEHLRKVLAQLKGSPQK